MPRPRKPLTVDDLWRLERVGGVALSPDGMRAVCALSTFSMDDNKGSSSLWLLPTDGCAPRRLTHCGEKDGAAAWSPQGGQIAFVARREQQGGKDETPQLYVIDADGGEARRASDFAPGVDAFKWFPDGRRIAFVAWVWPDEKGAKAQAKRFKAFKERKETAYVTSESSYRFWDHNLPMGRVAHLHVLEPGRNDKPGKAVDLLEGSSFELPRFEPDANGFDVSPDGKRIVFAFDPNAEQRADHCKALAEVDVRSSKLRVIAKDEAWDFEAPRYSADGTRIAFIASHQALKHTMPTQLALLDCASGDWQVLSADWDHAVNAPLRWSADGSAIYFTAEDHGRNSLWRFDLAVRSATLAVAGGWVQGFDVAGSGGQQVIVAAADAMDHPVRVHAQRDGSEPLRLERFNDDFLAGFALGRTESVTVNGAQQDAVQMWVVYPPGFDRKKKYPLLHSIHGGPHAASGDTFHYRWNNQVFAAQGYVVACVNYHGSSGFGYDFLDSITHRWGELEQQDVEAGTDWLLGHPWADPKRVFASGGSYGGFMVAWMNGHIAPGRYQAYVCHAGCFDWTGMFADDAWHWHAKELGGWYWEHPERVANQSPHTFAGAMHTPTLVAHGALDYRVPDGQGLAYYNTLKARGIDARLVWFPDENHWVLKPRNSKLWYGEFFAWLKTHDPGRAKKAKT